MNRKRILIRILSAVICILLCGSAAAGGIREWIGIPGDGEAAHHY